MRNILSGIFNADNTSSWTWTHSGRTAKRFQGRKRTATGAIVTDGRGFFEGIERGISWSQRGVYPAPWGEKLSKVDGDARVGQVRVTNPFWVCG